MVRYKHENARDIEVLKGLFLEVTQRYWEMNGPACRAESNLDGADRYLRSLEQNTLPFDRRPHIDKILTLLAEAEEELIELSHQEWYYVHNP